MYDMGNEGLYRDTVKPGDYYKRYALLIIQEIIARNHALPEL